MKHGDKWTVGFGCLLLGTGVFAIWIDRWLDKIALIGSVASIFGIPLALAQSYLSRTAAEAAQSAAEQTRSELIAKNYHFALQLARSFLGEANAWFVGKQWQLASMRMSDLASQLTRLSAMTPDVNNHWIPARNWLTAFCAGIRLLQNGRLSTQEQSVYWNSFHAEMLGIIDHESNPFQQ